MYSDNLGVSLIGRTDTPMVWVHSTSVEGVLVKPDIYAFYSKGCLV